MDFSTHKKETSEAKKGAMRELKYVVIGSAILAAITVLAALYFRQQPVRTGTDAYIPMRTLTAEEAAVLLYIEDNRDDKSFRRTVVGNIGDDVDLLTRDYVIPVVNDNERIVESHSVVQFKGKKYRIISNNWEQFVCQYKIKREPLESVLGHGLKQTSREDFQRFGFDRFKVSFSSERIWLYVIIEIVLAACVFISTYYLLVRLQILLKLPAFAVMEILLIFAIQLYSPAFFDADWFYQRIVVEEMALLFGIPFMVGGMPALYITALSLGIYILKLIGNFLFKKQVVSRSKFIFGVSLIISVIVTSIILGQYINYRSISNKASIMIGAACTALTDDATAMNHVLDEVKNKKEMLSKNIFKTNTLSTKAMLSINGILSVRVKGGPVLKLLLPMDDQYLFLWTNDYFSYGDMRALKTGGTSIVHYEYIQSAITTKSSYRTPFWKYFYKWLIRNPLDRYIEIQVLSDKKGNLSAVIIGSIDH